MSATAKDLVLKVSLTLCIYIARDLALKVSLTLYIYIARDLAFAYTRRLANNSQWQTITLWLFLNQHVESWIAIWDVFTPLVYGNLL